MYQRALICTDFTDGMYRLTAFVPELQAGGLRHIVFFHNVPIDDDRGIPRIDQAQITACCDRFQANLNDIPDGITVEVKVESGRIVNNILQVIKADDIDVVILGASTRTLLQEQLFGSTTKELLQKTPIPLMILRPQLISAYTTEELALRCRHLFRYVLLPYDDSNSAKSIISRILTQLDTYPEGTLEQARLLWVIDDSIREELRAGITPEKLQTTLKPVADSLAVHNIDVKTEVQQGDPCAEILKAAERYDISAITLSSGSKGWRRWSVPSTTSTILRQSWHPVLVYPTVTS